MNLYSSRGLFFFVSLFGISQVTLAKQIDKKKVATCHTLSPSIKVDTPAIELRDTDKDPSSYPGSSIFFADSNGVKFTLLVSNDGLSIARGNFIASGNGTSLQWSEDNLIINCFKE